MPLYLQVAALMRQRIQNQQWRIGEQIPTLNELEKEYQVSRITLRASLDQLEQQGVIRRTRGLGTFVAKDLSEERWFKLPTTFDALVNSVADLKIRRLLIDQSDHPLDPAVVTGNVAMAYRRIRRVHYHKDVPYCLIEMYLEKSIYLQCPDAFDQAPVISILSSMKSLKIAAGKQTMRITISDEEAATHLNIGVGDPIADVCRTLLDANGQVIYYAHIQYPAQMIQLEIDLFR